MTADDDGGGTLYGEGGALGSQAGVNMFTPVEAAAPGGIVGGLVIVFIAGD